MATLVDVPRGPAIRAYCSLQMDMQLGPCRADNKAYLHYMFEQASLSTAAPGDWGMGRYMPVMAPALESWSM